MYKKFYGLSEKPFELTPDPKFLYFTPSHRKILASMVDGIRNRKSFITVIGEVGTGKTTLVHSLLNSLDEKVKTAFVFHTTVTFKDLLKIILRELGLVAREESATGLLHHLIQYLTQIAARDESVAIIIDEAQNLSRKVLEEIQIFCNLQPRLTQIILVGQPELEDKLNSEVLRQLQQSIEIRCQIRALNEKESEEYIDHRLKLVGSSASEIFTQKAISTVCSSAQGIPRIINVLCDNALLKGYSLSKKKIDVDIIREIMKEIEGPGPQKTTPPSTTTDNESRPSSPSSAFHLNKVLLVILSIFCLAGLLLLTHRYLLQRPAKTWDIESVKNSYVHTEPPSPPTPPQVAVPTPVAITSGENRVKQIVSVKEKQTVSYLTQRYYGMVNKTVIDLILDFNPEITNVHLILVNQEIKIPHITEGLLIIQSPGPAYEIHAGTFQTPNAAKVYSDELTLRGKKIEILPRKVSPQETWYRVVIGEFDDKDEALKMIHLLKEKNLLPAFGGLAGME